MRRLLPLAAVLFLGAAAPPRPAEWAEPLELPGVRNLHRVTPWLYRSEQPTAEGMRALKEKLGIKTVINLRALHSDRDEAAGTGLLEERLKLKTWDVEDANVVKVLALLRRRENGPFLIHCQHGADRTGLMTAMFRVVEQGWTKEAAVREMREGGYGFHSLWRNIPRYVRKSDRSKLLAAVDGAAGSGTLVP